MDLLRHVARSAGISMHRTMLHEQIVQAKNFTEASMKITNAVANHLAIDEVMHEVMDAAKLFINVQATSLYLVDKTKDELWVTDVQGVKALRIPVGTGLAGAAAATGGTIIVSDAYEDSRFDRSFDKRTGFRTQSVICIPIFENFGSSNIPSRVAAVFQAINRTSGDRVIPFNDNDVKILTNYSKEVSLVLRQISLETACLKIFADSCMEYDDDTTMSAKASLLSAYTSQNLTTMLKASDPMEKLKRNVILSLNLKKAEGSGFEALASWDADILVTSHREMYMFIQQVFRRYNFCYNFGITIALLQNFLETVRLKYRDNPFHNFHHGFHCFQGVYLLLQTDACREVFDELELIALLTAALCHGKYRGKNS